MTNPAMTESVLLAQARPHDDNHHTSIHSDYVNRSSTEHVQLARLAAAVYFYFRREDSS